MPASRRGGINSVKKHRRLQYGSHFELSSPTNKLQLELHFSNLFRSGHPTAANSVATRAAGLAWCTMMM